MKAKKIVMVKKNCADPRCTGTFSLSKGTKQDYCSRNCKLIHRGFSWKSDWSADSEKVA